MRLLLFILVTSFVVCIGLFACSLLKSDLVEYNDLTHNSFIGMEILFGGAITSILFVLVGGSGEVKIGTAKITGGYAVVIVIFILAPRLVPAPASEDFTQVINLHHEKGNVPFRIDVADPTSSDKRVVPVGVKFAENDKPGLLCRYKPGAKKTAVTFTVWANTIPFPASVTVSRSEGAETKATYEIVKQP